MDCHELSMNLQCSLKTINDFMSRTFFTFFSGAFFPMKNCTQIFINSNFVLLQIHMKLRQFTDLGKLSTLIHTELFQSLYISGRKLWGPDTNANSYEL